MSSLLPPPPSPISVGSKRQSAAVVDDEFRSESHSRVRDLTSKRVKVPSPFRTVDRLPQPSETPGNAKLIDSIQLNSPPATPNLSSQIHFQPAAAPESFELICSPSLILEPLDPVFVDQMWLSEQVYQPQFDYFHHQPHLDPSMRPILVDWMIEVAQEFTLGRETFHLAVNYVDRYLSIPPAQTPGVSINRANLQLLGVTSLFIASKLEEIYPPNAQDFATTTDGAYNPKQIDALEREVLSRLNWKLHPQTPFSWIKLFIQLVCHQIQAECDARLSTLADGDPLVDETISEFLALFHGFLSVDNFLQCMMWIDMTALDVQFLKFFPSAIAASALFLLHAANPTAVQLIEFCTGYSLAVLRPCITLVQFFTSMPRQSLSLAALKKPYFEELRIPRSELFARQQHFPDSLEYLNEIKSFMKSAANANNAGRKQ